MSTSLGHLTAAELEQHGAALRALGRSLLAGEAEDLVQDGWVQALQAGPPRHLHGWLAGTLRRLAAGRRRRDARRRARELQAARPEAMPSAASSAAAAETARRIAAAVERLAEPYRTAVVLRFWHGLEPRQLAVRLGVPANTARSRVQRGIEMLRSGLSQDAGSRAAWAAPLSALLDEGAASTASTAAWLPALLLMKTKLLVGAAAVLVLGSGLLLVVAQPGAARPSAPPGVTVASSPPAEVAATPPPQTQGDRSMAAAPGRTALTVHVVDEHDAPLADIEVEAFAEGGVPPLTARTDAGGTARLSLPASKHWVCADAGGTRVRPDLHSPFAEVEAHGEPCEVRLVMERYSCTVQVRLVDDLGTPVAGVVVTRRPESTGGRTPTELTTDAGGLATFTGLPPGRRWFELEGHDEDDLSVAIPDQRRSCDVERDGFARLDVELPRKATVHFRVQGVAGAEVNFQLQADSHFQGRRSWYCCTQHGEAMQRVPPGRCSFRPHLDAAAAAVIRGEITFEATPGATIEVPIPLEAARGVLVVTVLDEHGQPVDNASVFAIGGIAASYWNKGLWNATAAGGRYEIRGIPDGPLILMVDGRSARGRNLAFFGGTDAKPYLELAGPQSDLTVVLNDAYTIRGKAFDARNRPLTSGTVSLGMAAGSRSDSANLREETQGQFEFQGLRPGKYPLWLKNREEGPPDAEVEVGPRATPSHTAEIELRPRAR
jgi:RNA polymerase sigma factor (sigma-70 family)